MRKREIILLLLMALVLIACARCTRAEMQASSSTEDVTVIPTTYYPDPTDEPMPFYLTEEYQEMKRAEQEEKEREAELLRKSIEEYEEERQAEAERQFEKNRNNPVGDPVEDPIEDDEVEIDEDVLYLMANCVEAEAGDQGELGKRYVADVILNRVDHKDFPNTIEGVITQKYHFSAYWDGGMDRFKPTEETIRICREELVTRQNYEILFFAMGRYNPYGTPSFQYKDHYFSTE